METGGGPGDQLRACGRLDPDMASQANLGAIHGANFVFHALLQRLCDEHDREVASLRTQIPVLNSPSPAAVPVGSSCLLEPTMSAESLAGVADAWLAIPEDALDDVLVSPGGSAFAPDTCKPALPRSAFVREQHHGAVSQEEALDGTGSTSGRPVPKIGGFLERTRKSRFQAGFQAAAEMTGVAKAESSEKKQGTLFVDAEEMKTKVREAALRPEYDVAEFYHTEGLWQHIARHPLFERLTMAVIAVNSIWLAYDIDFNFADGVLEADFQFQVMENFFCIYFVTEWYIRFKAFKVKVKALCDFWFCFDSFLALMMAADAWLMSFVFLIMKGEIVSGLGVIKIARVLRLSRMARMVRLLRCMPELLILVKGMAVAFKSVAYTLALLLIFIYVFALTFRQMVGNDMQEKFGSIPRSMHTLWIDGTLLDNVGGIVEDLANIHLIWSALFYVFILISAFTVANMLIGVLCEVVSAVAGVEREAIAVSLMRERLEEVWRHQRVSLRSDSLDLDSTTICKEEFEAMLQNPATCRLLEESGVDPVGLVDFLGFLFEGEGDDEDGAKKMTFSNLFFLLLQLRGSNTATVKDIVDLRKFTSASIMKVRKDLRVLQGLDNNNSNNGKNIFGTRRLEPLTEPRFEPYGEPKLLAQDL